MKDIVLLVGVFMGAYIVSMGILYVAFRVFFPIKVEKNLSESDFQVHAGSPVMKISRDSRTGRNNARLPKIKLAHG